ncbi:hypothetical protein [Helicobacter sp. T3_23-1056]
MNNMQTITEYIDSINNNKDLQTIFEFLQYGLCVWFGLCIINYLTGSIKKTIGLIVFVLLAIFIKEMRL